LKLYIAAGVDEMTFKIGDYVRLKKDDVGGATPRDLLVVTDIVTRSNGDVFIHFKIDGEPSAPGGYYSSRFVFAGPPMCDTKEVADYYHAIVGF
jgi:hypothetical protein